MRVLLLTLKERNGLRTNSIPNVFLSIEDIKKYLEDSLGWATGLVTKVDIKKGYVRGHYYITATCGTEYECTYEVFPKDIITTKILFAF